MSFTEKEMKKWTKAELIDHVIDIEKMLEADKLYRKKLIEVLKFVQMAIDVNGQIMRKGNFQEEMLFTVGQLQAYKRTFLVIDEILNSKKGSK